MRILIIEDDLDLCEALRLHLKKENIEADFCGNGNDAPFYALENIYDAIVIDRMLPGIDGLSILRLIRSNNIHTPIILATAMGEVQDRIQGLDGGADDYITKPYDVNELLARIRALCRRPVQLTETTEISFGDLRFLEEKNELSCREQTLSLSKKEAELLAYFLKNPKKTLSRSLLLSYVWGADAAVEEGNLDNYIHFLRKRLKALGSHTVIRTVHGVGYCLEDTL